MFKNIEAHILNERKHLVLHPKEDEQSMALGTIHFIVECEDVNETLKRTKDILSVVNYRSLGQWPSKEEWNSVIPRWFLDQCAPETTVEEAREKMELEKRQGIYLDKAKEAIWEFPDWIYWFQPENREWFWWDGVYLDPNHFVVAVEANGWPFPWGALSWLLRASGADKVTLAEYS